MPRSRSFPVRSPLHRRTRRRNRFDWWASKCRRAVACHRCSWHVAYGRRFLSRCAGTGVRAVIRRLRRQHHQLSRAYSSGNRGDRLASGLVTTASRSTWTSTSPISPARLTGRIQDPRSFSTYRSRVRDRAIAELRGMPTMRTVQDTAPRNAALLPLKARAGYLATVTLHWPNATYAASLSATTTVSAPVSRSMTAL